MKVFIHRSWCVTILIKMFDNYESNLRWCVKSEIRECLIRWVLKLWLWILRLTPKYKVFILIKKWMRITKQNWHTLTKMEIVCKCQHVFITMTQHFSLTMVFQSANTITKALIKMTHPHGQIFFNENLLKIFLKFKFDPVRMSQQFCEKITSSNKIIWQFKEKVTIIY